jgi:probable phosphoglycerate mutase
MRLFIIRHAEPEPLSDACPDEKRGLSPLGREQAGRLPVAFAGVALDGVISSTMARAAETAAPLVEALGLLLRREPKLSEIDLGSLSAWGASEQVRWAEVTACWASGDLSIPCPDGESLIDMMARVEPVADRLLSESWPQGLAIVGHAVVNSIVLWALCPELASTVGQNLGHSHAGVWEIEGEGRSFRVVRRNDVSHLRTPLDAA